MVKNFFLIGSSAFYASFCLIIMIIMVIFSLSIGEAAEGVQEHEVVFVLDASHSMNETDQAKLVPDFFESIMYKLPSNYKVGFVVYGSDVRDVKLLDAERRDISAALRQVEYTGYTNAGAGLERALSLFSQGNAATQTVIVISDGEIMMENSADTQISQERFKRAIEAADSKGVLIYTVAIGDLDLTAQANIYEAAKQQKRLFYADNVEQLNAIGKDIVHNKFGIAKIAVNSGDFTSDALRVRLPLKHGDSVNSAKICLTSTALLGQLGANYTASEGLMIQGKHFAVLSLRQPQSEMAEIRIGSAGGNLQADLIVELQARIQTEVVVSDGQMNPKTAQIRLIPVSTANQNLHILDDPYFADKQVRIVADGKEMMANVEKGAIVFSLPADQAHVVKVKVHYEDLGINIIAPEITEIAIEPKEGYGKMVAVIAIIAVMAAVLILWNLRRKKVTVPLPPPVSRYEYAGKLKIYITKAPDESDVAPMEYNLYRHFDREELRLGSILDKCAVVLPLPGAQKILFSPGANKALIMTNQSDCTILRNRDLLVKDHSCLVYFGERIHIVFEDEHSELILEYKNVKPSERH